jgi:hypothetical protein
VRRVATDDADADISGNERKTASERHSIHEYVCRNGSKVHAN